MATSPAHKFGQVIGNLIEEIIRPILMQFAKTHGYYLDAKGKRGKARSGKKVTWEDKYGNKHDLDFVLEKDGNKDQIGRPLAFIETAWRRYTKHARNKAQEIQGAILPIAEKHSLNAPFLGVVLAGIFTEGAINQLQSSGFAVLYIKRESIIAAFNTIGISIEFDETTKDSQFSLCLKQLTALDTRKKEKLISKLNSLNTEAIKAFMERLEKTLSRYVETILITPLFGTSEEFTSSEKAIQFLEKEKNLTPIKNVPLHKIDILIAYSNGDKAHLTFQNKTDALDFLRKL